jgi:hypothetical protein
VDKGVVQFVLEALVFPFQFNEMCLNGHSKPPWLIETSDSIRNDKCTLPPESVDGHANRGGHFLRVICNER